MNVLEKLKELNALRCEKGFKMKLHDWKLSQWSNAVAGETGELCNICKKFDRGDFDEDGEKYFQMNQELAKEAADIVIYLDLLCQSQNIDLADAIVSKFNEVSERVGSDIKMC